MTFVHLTRPRRSWLGLAVAVIALVQAGTATAATHRPAGPTFTIGRTHPDPAAAFADAPTLATASDQRGDCAVAWLNSHRDGTESIELAERTPNGRLRPARTVYTDAGHLGAPSLAIDGGGQVTIAFTRFTENLRGRQVMEISPGLAGPSGHLARVSPAGTLAEAPAVAVAPDGATTIVYQRDAAIPNGSPRRPGVPSQVMAAFRGAEAQHFGTPVAISAIDSRAAGRRSGTMAPQVAASAAGSFVAEWLQAGTDPASSLGTLQTATAGSDGRFGAATPLGGAELRGSGSAGAPDLAANPAGDVLALWPSGPSTAEIAARGSASPSFSAPTAISTGHGSGLAVALAPDRKGLLVSAAGDRHATGRLSTLTYHPGQGDGTIKPGSTLQQARPAGSGQGRIVPSAPSIAFFHSVPIVTWQESSFAPAGRPGTAAHAGVTLEYAVGENFAHLGGGRVLIHRALAGTPTGALRGATLVGGGNGQIYEIFVQNGGKVLATAVNRAIFR